MNYFDCHADTLTKIGESESLWENTGCLDIKRVRGFADSYTQIFALWQDKNKITGQTEAAFQKMYEKALQLLKEQAAHITWCQNAAEMHRAHAQGKAAAFLSVEDISLMGSLTQRVREYGIRFVLLTWNYENAYACGAAAGQSKGLTDEGRALVKKLIKQQAVLDISHLSDQGAEDIFQLTDRPLMASHSNVRDICGHPRNLKKEHIQELIRRKGLMGINFYDQFVGGGMDMQALLLHMDAVLALGGEDILALGGDFDGCGTQFPKGIAGVQSVPYLKEAMEKAGFGNALIEKIFYKNARRFLEQNLAGSETGYCV